VNGVNVMQVWVDFLKDESLKPLKLYILLKNYLAK